jgi:hypothetical protein
MFSEYLLTRASIRVPNMQISSECNYVVGRIVKALDLALVSEAYSKEVVVRDRVHVVIVLLDVGIALFWSCLVALVA